MIAFIFTLFLAPSALAFEYDRVDPPGALTFDTVRARVVAVPNAKVPDTCEPGFRAGMENAFQNLWTQCQAIGRQEPSDCQRALFDRCTKQAADLQKMESESCLEMHGESEAIGAFKSVDNQQTSQSAAADLNQRAYVATKKVVVSLEKGRAALDAQIRSASASLSAATCAGSTSARAYGAVGKQVTTQLQNVRKHVDSTITAKQSAAAQFAANSGVSQKNLDELVSLPPRSSTITGAVSAPAPTPVMALPPPPPSPERKINWVPILAVGIPAAAILTAIVVSKNSLNQVSDNGVEGGGGVGPNPGDGGYDPTPTSIKGGGDAAAWGLRFDPSFTDQEKAGIAAGFAKIPDCFRYKLKGMYMQNKVLPRLSRDRCVAGQYIFGGNTIYFSPSCTQNTVPIGVAVHEMFHVIGNRNDNAVHKEFWKVRDAHPNCPVSEYAATNEVEDFAETGRLLIYPDSGLGARYSGACVDAKIEGMRKILNQCPIRE